MRPLCLTTMDEWGVGSSNRGGRHSQAMSTRSWLWSWQERFFFFCWNSREKKRWSLSAAVVLLPPPPPLFLASPKTTRSLTHFEYISLMDPHHLGIYYYIVTPRWDAALILSYSSFSSSLFYKVEMSSSNKCVSFIGGKRVFANSSNRVKTIVV